jgi:hypothetical protein
LRTLDPKIVGAARSREAFEEAHARPLPDGTVFGLRWVPTTQGVALNERLKIFTRSDYQAYIAAASRGGAITRWNGSLLYPTKVPDLIGIRDRKYIDSTATHLHRGIGDLMRYAALVSFAETTDFGAYHPLLPDSRRVPARMSEEALYALALY